MFKEFKEFALQGNVMDLAIGIVIGAAFGKIVTSFVNDILMPPIGLLMGKVDFADLYLNLSSTAYPSLTLAREAGAPVIAYGMFLNNIIDFLIVAIAIFFVIRLINKLKKEAKEEVTTKECGYCFSEIPLLATRCPQCTSELEAK